MSFIRQAASEAGEPSSKRLAGLIGLAVMHLIATYCAIRFGMTDNVQTLCITLTITDGSLLGITAVTKAISDQ